MSSYLNMTGRADDLEAMYLVHPAKTLPDPPGFPFDVQGQPIWFDQPHTTPLEMAVATHPPTNNPLPFQSFVGVGYQGQIPRQINQPEFLSVNEIITFQ
jgi:hypothetical protein